MLAVCEKFCCSPDRTEFLIKCVELAAESLEERLSVDALRSPAPSVDV
jgi:hypothetical protein